MRILVEDGKPASNGMTFFNKLVCSKAILGTYFYHQTHPSFVSLTGF